MNKYARKLRQDKAARKAACADAQPAVMPKEIINSLGMKFVLIPAGNFLMGATKTFEGHERNASQHQVTISSPFYMQKTPVTQSHWEKVMGYNPSHCIGADGLPIKDFFWKYYAQIERKGQVIDDLPVEMVSWNDTKQFIDKLNLIEATDGYSLLTEAQWEYACRAVSLSAWNFGDASYHKEVKYAWLDIYWTQPVGLKASNDWGLYDMHGNVWEWVEDWFGTYPSEGVTDPQGPPSGDLKVLRGGPWHCAIGYGRSATRLKQPPNWKHRHFGFRITRKV